MNKIKLYSLALLGVTSAFATDVSISRSDFEPTKVYATGPGGMTDCSVDSKGNIYLYVEQGNVVGFNTSDSILVSASDIPNHTGYAFSNDTLFVGNALGNVVKHYNGEIDTLPRVPNSDIVTSLAQHPNGNLIAVTTLGYFSYDGTEWTRLGDNGFSSDDFKFSGDTLWAGGIGVSRLENNSWSQYGSINIKQINTDRKGGMIGSGFSGMIDLVTNEGVQAYKTFDDAVSTTFTDANGLIWLGNYDNDGIRIYDPVKDSIVASVDSLMGDLSKDGTGMVRFVESNNGDLWACGEAWYWKYTGDVHRKIAMSSSVISSSSAMSSSSAEIDPVIVSPEGLSLIDQGNHWSLIGLQQESSVEAFLISSDGATKLLGSFKVQNSLAKISKPELVSGKLWLKVNGSNKSFIFPVK